MALNYDFECYSVDEDFNYCVGCLETTFKIIIKINK